MTTLTATYLWEIVSMRKQPLIGLNEFLKMAGAALGLFVCGCQPPREPFRIELCATEGEMPVRYVEAPTDFPLPLPGEGMPEWRVDPEALCPVLFAFVLEQNAASADFPNASQIALRVDIAVSGGQTVAIWRQMRYWRFVHLHRKPSNPANEKSGTIFTFMVSAREDEWTNRDALWQLSRNDKAVCHLEILDGRGTCIFSAKSREFFVKEFMPYRFWGRASNDHDE